nr:MAG TPA: YopX protein [Caudoviricetes sp.]
MIPKFRAWLKKEQEMDNEIDHISWLEDELYCIGDGITYMVLAEDLVLMQSTGLRDKNGKEIFEGDILKNNKYITSVFYERGAYCVKFCRTTNTTVTMNVISFIEKYKTKVIGNIYENPELLEVE